MKSIKLTTAALALIATAAFTTSANAGGLGASDAAANGGDLILGIYDSSNSVANSLEIDLGQFNTLTNGETFALASDISSVFASNTANLKFSVDASGGTFGAGDLGVKEIQVTTTGTIVVPASTSTPSGNINNETVNSTGSGFADVGTNPNAVSVANTDSNSFKTRAVTDNGGNYGLNSAAAPGGILAAYAAGTIVTLYDFAGGQAMAMNDGTFTVLGNGTSIQYNAPLAAVPEPSTYALGLLGLGILWFLKRRNSVASVI